MAVLNDRRHHPRCRPIRDHQALLCYGALSMEARVFDFSVGGLSVLGRGPIPLKTSIRAEIALGDIGHEYFGVIPCVAEVVSVRNVLGYYRLGLKITKIQEKHQVAWRRAIGRMLQRVAA